MRHIKPCARCGAGISGSKRYCAPCIDIRRIEGKNEQNVKRAKQRAAEGVRYVGTKRGMLKVRQ